MLKYLLKLFIIVIIVCFNIPEIFVGGTNYHTLDGNNIKTQDIIAGDIFFEIIDPSELEYTYRVRPAKDFGAPFNSSFKANNVALVPTDPFDACTDEFLNADDIDGNVALVERGECTFVTKAINVEKAGARAIIITELDAAIDFEYYIEMIHDNSGRDASIPAGYLIGKSGRIITQTLKKLHKRYARINLPVNLTFTPPHKMNHPPWMAWFEKWRFETWNEPDLANFNVNHFDYNLYLDYIAKTKFFVDLLAKYIKSQIQLHGPAGLFKNQLNHPFCWGILDVCNQNFTKCPFNVITFHRKGYELGASNEILTGTIDLVKILSAKFPNLKHLPYANDESDPLTGWSRPNEFHADVRYASIFVSSILLHLNAKFENILPNLSFLSNDNGFLSYYPFQFEQRTLLARFQINNTSPSHVQYFVKPIYASMHLLNNLEKLCDRITILDNNYTYIVTKNRKQNATFYSAILTPTHIDQYTIDHTVVIKLNVADFVDNENYIFIELLENNRTDPFNFWKTNYRRIPYPNYKQRHRIRARQYPRPLQYLTGITCKNIATFQYNITSPFVMSIRIVNSLRNMPKYPVAPTHLSYIKIYKNFELLLTWRLNSTNYIQTYQIYFRKTFNWICLTCNEHMPFLQYQYQRYGGTKNILGAYKVRSIDLFGRKSKFSQIMKVY